MRTASASLLDYQPLKDLVGRHVASAAARRLLDAMEPSSDRAALQEAHADAREAMAYLQAATQPQPAVRGAAIRPRFDNLPDIEPQLAKLRIEGSVIEPKEILEILELLDRAGDLRAVLTAAGGRFPRLAEQAHSIGDFRPLLRELAGRILPDGSIADNASPALQRIRRDLERQQRGIRETLDRFLRSHRDDGVLQEDFITLRNDRFVVPVVAGQKRRVEGVVHAASGSGHTLFIEPFETIEMNNDLVRLREQEQREVFRIVEEMSGRLRVALTQIREAAVAMAALEFLFAKASFGARFRCVMPRFSEPDQPRLSLEEARHPLLEDVLGRQGRAVVPLTLRLEGATRTLLISGPNTGGKTVALKTIGLLALMAQSGVPVPASRAEFPLFENVLADLGDHQSIEQSLSSFSSHVTRVKEILDLVSPDSLVLLDELGRATDPDEGGALAVAVLEQVRVWNAFLVASTHLLAPKIYGATAAGVANGAMSFDESTLEPSYHLHLGAPGASAGLKIAARLGLPASVIERARSSLSSQQQDWIRLLQSLEETLAAARQREQELRAQRDALAEETAAVATVWEKRESQKWAELDRRSEALAAEFQGRAAQLIGEIEAAGLRKAAAQAQRRVSGLKSELRDSFAALAPSPEAVPPAAALCEGARVRLRGVGQPARVRRLLSGGRIEVEAGLLKLQAPVSDVIEVLSGEEGAEGAAQSPSHIAFRGAGRPAVRELSIIGQRAGEARDAVERFLDQALLGTLSEVRIVHGHGMGVLKRMVAEVLRSDSHVEAFHDAPQAEGGAGATIVKLRTG